MPDVNVPPAPATPALAPVAPVPVVPAPEAIKKPRGRPRGPAKRMIKTARVSVTTGFNLFIHTQGVMVIPGREPTVELDHLVDAQLKAGILKEVK